MPPAVWDSLRHDLMQITLFMPNLLHCDLTCFPLDPGDAAPQWGSPGPGAPQPAEGRLGARRWGQGLLPVQPAHRPRGTQGQAVWWGFLCLLPSPCCLPCFPSVLQHLSCFCIQIGPQTSTTTLRRRKRATHQNRRAAMTPSTDRWVQTIAATNYFINLSNSVNGAVWFAFNKPYDIWCKQLNNIYFKICHPKYSFRSLFTNQCFLARCC